MSLVRFIALFLISLGMAPLRAQTQCKSMTDDCEVSVSGKTTIGGFACSVAPILRNGSTRVCKEASSEDIIFNSIEFQVPIDDFGCGNPIISSDLAELLDSENHPYVVVVLEELSLSKSSHLTGRGLAQVSVMGITKMQHFDIHVDNSEQQTILTGHMKLDLQDYNIAQPTRFFGLIKIEPIVNINFTLVYE